MTDWALISGVLLVVFLLGAAIGYHLGFKDSYQAQKIKMDFILNLSYLEYSSFPLISELTVVTVSKTTDTGNYVIKLQNVSGETCSLWLEGSEEQTRLPIRSITEY